MSKYVSYYQKVTTVGFVTNADSIEEAERKAQILFEQSSKIVIFDETPMELSDTEEITDEQFEEMCAIQSP